MTAGISEDIKKASTLKITLTRSLIGRPDAHRKIAKTLGLTKTDDVVTRANTPTILGNVRKISHLLTVEAV